MIVLKIIFAVVGIIALITTFISCCCLIHGARFEKEIKNRKENK